MLIQGSTGPIWSSPARPAVSAASFARADLPGSANASPGQRPGARQPATPPSPVQQTPAGVRPAGPVLSLDMEQIQALQEEGDERSKGPQDLSPEEEKQVQKLSERDGEVRRHEQAHAMVGGPYAGQPSYEYEQGPDGKRYAVGGEVKIDVSPAQGDPEATIEKMRIVKAAALAPAEPSGQDRAVAAQAEAQRLQAEAELMKQKSEEMEGSGTSGEGGRDIPLGRLTDFSV